MTFELGSRVSPLSASRSIKSTFQFRTFDPEGVIFYGDTKNGEDWFVLSLKEGFPLMQISKEDVQVSVTGGPKLNDGKWHTPLFPVILMILA
uniref:Laminin G domain-containing protein n=1 Tax=Poecilia mexicana TaxID=48701 RepID=A0A3B3Y3F2_9TELE